MDDINEFLKRPYYGEESIERIPKLATFYNQTSIIVPNYFALGQSESKFLFKNIHRKNKLLMEASHRQPDDRIPKDGDRFFDTNFKIEVQNQEILKDKTGQSFQKLVEDFNKLPTEQSFQLTTHRHQRQPAWSSYASSTGILSLHDCSQIQSEFDSSMRLQSLQDSQAISIQLNRKPPVRAERNESSEERAKNVQKTNNLAQWYNRPHKKQQIIKKNTNIATGNSQNSSLATLSKQPPQKLQLGQVGMQKSVLQTISSQVATGESRPGKKQIQLGQKSKNQIAQTFNNTPLGIQIIKQQNPLSTRHKTPEQTLIPGGAAHLNLNTPTMPKVSDSHQPRFQSSQSTSSLQNSQKQPAINIMQQLNNLMVSRQKAPVVLAQRTAPNPVYPKNQSTSPVARGLSGPVSPQANTLQTRFHGGSSKVIQSLVTSASKQQINLQVANSKSPSSLAPDKYLTSTCKPSQLRLKSQEKATFTKRKGSQRQLQINKDAQQLYPQQKAYQNSTCKLTPQASHGTLALVQKRPSVKTPTGVGLPSNAMMMSSQSTHQLLQQHSLEPKERKRQQMVQTTRGASIPKVVQISIKVPSNNNVQGWNSKGKQEQQIPSLWQPSPGGNLKVQGQASKRKAAAELISAQQPRRKSVKPQ